jgi:hypothetical protein
MGKKKDPKGTGEAAQIRRLRWEAVLELVLRGWSRERIVRRMAPGSAGWEVQRVDGKAGTGVLVHGPGAEVGRLVDEIASRYQAAHDDPRVLELVVGAGLDRLAEIAELAVSAGQFHAAIAAIRLRLATVSRRSPRWSGREDGDGDGDGERDGDAADGGRGKLADKRNELRGLTDEELAERAAAAGLPVH